MAQTTIQGSFLGDGTVTGAKVAADFISAQTALATGLATTDEIIVSDAGVIKRMDISVLEIAATQITASGTLPALNGAALTALTAANITASGTLPALNGAALTALTAANITASGTLPALNGAALTALNGSQITTGTVADARISALTASKLTGALPAISGANLTNLPASGISVNGTTDNAFVTYDNGNTRLNTESTITYDGTNMLIGAYLQLGGQDTALSKSLQFRDTQGAEYEIEYRSAGLNFSEVGVAHYRLYIKDDGDITVLENNSSPSVVKGIAKAWGRVNGAGTLQTGDYGISSATLDSAGRYTWTWDTAFENEYYAMFSDVNETTAAGVSVVDRAGNTSGAGKSSTYTQVHTSDGDDLGSLPHHVVVFGEAT